METYTLTFFKKKNDNMQGKPEGKKYFAPWVQNLRGCKKTALNEKEK